MLVGVDPILESGARARAKFFIFYFLKKVTRAIPAARADPKSKTILFFFCKVMVHALGLRPAQPASLQYKLPCTGVAPAPTLGCANLKKSGARARVKFFILYFFQDGDHTMPRKKKAAAGKSGARADPNPHWSARSP